MRGKSRAPSLDTAELVCCILHGLQNTEQSQISQCNSFGGKVGVAQQVPVQALQSLLELRTILEKKIYQIKFAKKHCNFQAFYLSSLSVVNQVVLSVVKPLENSTLVKVVAATF
jgi:hypothetical protein